MKHFIHLKDIPARDLRKILVDAKKRKHKRERLSTLQLDKDSPSKLTPAFANAKSGIIINAT